MELHYHGLKRIKLIICEQVISPETANSAFPVNSPLNALIDNCIKNKNDNCIKAIKATALKEEKAKTKKIKEK